jgi:urea transport system permease protein
MCSDVPVEIDTTILFEVSNMSDFFTHFELLPFLNALIIGLSVASIWLVAALGLTIIYGTMGVINMAHGEFIMLGAYTTYVLQSFLGVPFLLCLPLSFVVLAAIGWGVERSIVRKLYSRPLDTLLATWGLSLILIQGVRLIFGGSPKYVGVPDWLNFVFDAGFIHLSGLRIFIMIVAAGLVFMTWYLMYRTTLGIRIRAVMQDKEMASSFGIDSNRIYSITFAYGAGLAGVAGALFGALKTLFPDMGGGFIVEAFLVVVVGGGQLIGSVASATLLGELNSVFSYFTNDTFARFVLFTLVVIFLRFRPQGLITDGVTRR